MPELPEVEVVARGLRAAMIGKRITRVDIARQDIIDGPSTSSALLQKDTVTDVARQGKQLALIGASGGVVNIHLGMTGTVTARPARETCLPHTHIVWTLGSGQSVRFTDPRRFGGVWCFESMAALREARWNRLGPDALTVTPRELGKRLGRTTRGLKAALLDQQLVAGLGNIYVDELLFAARLHPSTPADRVDLEKIPALVRQMRRILSRAIEAGGSSIQDHLGADGKPGWYQWNHQAYGRAGEPCKRCGEVLVTGQVGGRTTVWCPVCQARD